MLEALCQRHDFSLTTPVCDLPEDILDIVIHGDSEPIKIDGKALSLIGGAHMFEWEGIAGIIEEETSDSSTNQ